MRRAYTQRRHVQFEDLWRIPRLDAVALALPRVTCDDGEICASDGKDGAAVLGVRVKLAFLGVCEGAVGHCVGQRAG